MFKKSLLALTVITVLLMTATVVAEIPRIMNFQGYLADINGNRPDDGIYTATFKIYNDSTSNDPLWEETQDVTIGFGLYSVRLGDSNAIEIDTNQELWLEVDFENWQTDSRYRLASVPYALSAIFADRASFADSCENISNNWHVVDSILYTNNCWGIVRGGAGNVMGGNDPHTLINLGVACTTLSPCSYATIGGGFGNKIRHNYGTIAGGNNNVIEQNYNFIGGGSNNLISESYCVIGGGLNNVIERSRSVIAGGKNNTVEGEHSVISGGLENHIHSGIANSTIGGGTGNSIDADGVTITGGKDNEANGQFSTICGGEDNITSGYHSTVAGGSRNTASGNLSFAAGDQAQALHNGSFVWACDQGGEFVSTAANQFNIRASGGVRIYSDSDGSIGVELPPNESWWVSVSDSTKKRNIRQVNSKEILKQLSQLPIKRWIFKNQKRDIEHIGPMAQDFYTIFGLGYSDTTISEGDPAGIALAACQGLHKITQEQNTEIEQLKAQINELQNRLSLILTEYQGKPNSEYKNSFPKATYTSMTKQDND